ncbi:glycosyltransferase family 4 protein [Aeromonas veronii]|uniref:glycosyltransferase family 4 protein n=1 Tax=Aeromonas veronii TaxID=654 RepID=UPI003D1D3024
MKQTASLKQLLKPGIYDITVSFSAEKEAPKALILNIVHEISEELKTINLLKGSKIYQCFEYISSVNGLNIFKKTINFLMIEESEVELQLYNWDVEGQNPHIRIDLSTALNRYFRDTKALVSENKRLISLEKDYRRQIHKQIYKNQRLKNTLSYRIGNYLVTEPKSPKFYLTVLSKIYRIYKNFKSQSINTLTTIDDVKPKTFSTDKDSSITIRFELITSTEEIKNDALLKFEFPGLKPSRDLAKYLGVSFSENIGLFKYIAHTEKYLTVKTPENTTHVVITPSSWFSTRDLFFKFENEKTNRHEIDQKLDTLKQGNAYEAKVIEAKTLPYDEQLKAIIDALVGSNDSALIAKYLKVVIDLGAISEASELLTKVKSIDRLKFKRQVNAVIGYNNLSKQLPVLPSKLATAKKPSNTVIIVAHCALPTHSNGYATRTHEVAKEISKNYKVIVLTRTGYPCDVVKYTNFTTTIVDEIEYRNIDGAHYYDDSLDQYISKSADALTIEISTINPKAVIGASAFYTSLPALIASRHLGIPFIYEIRGLWEITRASSFPGWGNSERFKLESTLETYTAKNADHIFAITQAVKNEMIKRGVDGDKISLTPNAIRKEKFLEKTNNEIDYNPIKNIPVIGYVGSVVDYEGLDDLIYALEILYAKGVKFQLVIAGDGAALANLKAQAEKSPISHLITFLGRIPHESVGKLMEYIDITPFPRKSIEVCELVSPLKPFESMILSKAIVASNVNALAEIINGSNGILFEKGNIHDLSEKLEILLSNKEHRAKLGRSAYEWVLANRLWSHVGNTYIKTIENCKIPKPDISKTKAKILVYGDVDVNYIDGSSVWVVSLTELLSSCNNTQVELLLKSDDYNSAVLQQITNQNKKVVIHRPSDFGLSSRMSPEQATGVLKSLVSLNGYDGLVIRGQQVLRELDKHPEFNGLIWSYPVDIMQKADDEIEASDKAIIKRSAKILCQSEFIKKRLINHFNIVEEKIVDIPPMVPDSENLYLNRNAPLDSKFKLVYAGKFDKLWATEEMLNCFIRLRQKNKDIELHVYGDKFNTTEPAFRANVERLLSSEGIYWYKGVTREQILNELPTYDLAWGWRSKELEESTHEISTKFLEAASKGLPILCYDGPVFNSILGLEYPLKAKCEIEIEKTISKCIGEKSILNSSSLIVHDAVQKFFYSTIIKDSLQPQVDNQISSRKNKSILFAGHDLKFIRSFIEQFRTEGYQVYIDKWQSHNKHDVEISKRLLSKADHIFCEWALGNAVWYSNNILSHQQLTIRFHRQEVETSYPKDINLDAVNNFLFIAPHVMREARAKFWDGKPIGSIMENYVDCDDLNKPKYESAKYTLGIVGVVPRMKRLDKALDILEALNSMSPKYTLRVKGKLAKDYPWMLNRPEEMAYYNDLENRIANSPYLRDAVIFDGHGNDMAEWFRHVGYLLSVSDFEGCHLSAMEAMAAGTIPLIHKWEGADEIYPGNSIFDCIPDITTYLLNDNSKYLQRRIEAEKYAIRWNVEGIVKEIKSIL